MIVIMYYYYLKILLKGIFGEQLENRNYFSYKMLYNNRFIIFRRILFYPFFINHNVQYNSIYYWTDVSL
ncbi:hypothetical protein M0802_016438 [Mischocyttarus mexicanus]|nr:hypothetical protein M0802_016438 [Mischocyttarus mexicanus]